MAYVDEILADVPYGYWRLDETTGTVVADASGNGHAGTFQGGYTLAQPGIPAGGTSVGLNGTSGYLALGNVTSSAVKGWEIWVYFPSERGPDSAVASIIEAGTGSLFGGLYVGDVTGDFADEVLSWVGTPHGERAIWRDAAGVITAGFHHIVVAYSDANSRWEIYFDGVLVSNHYDSTPHTPHAAPALRVGSRASSGGTLFFEGRVDEVAIYPSLSPTRITAHYDAGVAGGGGSTIEEAITLHVANAILNTAGASAEAALSLAAVLTGTAQAEVLSDAALTLAADLILATSGGTTLEETITLAGDYANTASAQRVTEDALTLSHVLAASADAAATASPEITLSTAASLAATAQALVEAGFSLSQVVAITTSASAIGSDVTLADGRTLTVRLEGRTLVVEETSRTFAVPYESRTLTVEANA